MDPELHKAAVQGRAKSLENMVKRRSDILDSRTPQGNTALHIAAELGHAAFVGKVLGMNSKLLVSKNANGDTPLHLAARAGKVGVAELLILQAGEWPDGPPPEPTNQKDGAPSSPESTQSPLFMTNMAGDIPLHEAVKHGRSAVALKLFAAKPSSGHALNEKQQSPLHIAAREGLADVVANIVGQPWVSEKFNPSDSVSGTALHQAVLGGHTRVVEILLETMTPEEQIGLTDARENNVLHYVAQKNNARLVRLVLNRKADLAYKRNGELQSPLHVAAQYGSTKAVRELLKHCPDVVEVVDLMGRNAFHVAITSGQVEVLKCLLKHVRPEEMVNRVDRDGNTPLHLAVAKSIQSALLLLKDRRVNPCVLNRDGHSARSLIEGVTADHEMDTYEMYLWMKLKKQEASRCKKEQMPPVGTYQPLRSSRTGYDEYYKLSVGTYTLVATLIATVSFAATFTMPGGYSQNEGTAIHGHRAPFKMFVISNTVAMCSSIVVLFLFIWACRDPSKFHLNNLMWGHRLTILACLAMVVSLMNAVYITVPPTARWPAYVVIAIATSTPVVLFLILGKEMMYVPM